MKVFQCHPMELPVLEDWSFGPTVMSMLSGSTSAVRRRPTSSRRQERNSATKCDTWTKVIRHLLSLHPCDFSASHGGPMLHINCQSKDDETWRTDCFPVSCLASRRAESCHFLFIEVALSHALDTQNAQWFQHLHIWGVVWLLNGWIPWYSWFFDHSLTQQPWVGIVSLPAFLIDLKRWEPPGCTVVGGLAGVVWHGEPGPRVRCEQVNAHKINQTIS